MTCMCGHAFKLMYARAVSERSFLTVDHRLLTIYARTYPSILSSVLGRQAQCERGASVREEGGSERERETERGREHLDESGEVEQRRLNGRQQLGDAAALLGANGHRRLGHHPLVHKEPLVAVQRRQCYALWEGGRERGRGGSTARLDRMETWPKKGGRVCGGWGMGNGGWGMGEGGGTSGRTPSPSPWLDGKIFISDCLPQCD